MNNADLFYSERPIQESQLTGRDRLPLFVPFTPAAGAVAVGTVSAPIEWTVSPRDFVCTHISWTTTLQGIPRHIEPFNFSIEDTNSFKRFTIGRVPLSAITGVSIDGTEFKTMFKLSEPWRFVQDTKITVELQNVGCHAATPTVLLHGYLD